VLHLLVHVPPQSTSVSLPFFTVSLQLGAWQMPPEQTLLWQSELAVQVLLVAQRLHVVAPPQSMSLSAPFFTMSLQVGAAQSPFVHTPL
jgi:hypothetical protein